MYIYNHSSYPFLDWTPTIVCNCCCHSFRCLSRSLSYVFFFRENPSLEILRLLIAAEPSLPSLKNHLDSLPLHDALEVADMKCADALLYLLNACPAAASTPSGKGLLPLHLLAMRPRPSLELARQLLEICPESVRHASQQGLWLPLHCAVSKSYPSK